MKLRITTLLIIAFYLFIGNKSLFAQDDAAQKAMTDYMTPGKMHEMLAKNVGEWKTKMKLWMQPGGDPIVAEGTVIAEMILGGRYLQSKHSSTFMNMPMQGLEIDAYDNGTKEFISIWMDNMGTGIMVLKGNLNADRTVLTMTGEAYEPASGKNVKIKEVVKYVKEGYELMEMYMNSDGKEFKSMEVEMTKVK